MDESTKPKRNRAEKKNKKQQIKDSKTENIDDNVFNEDTQQQQVYLLLYSTYCFLSLACMFAMLYLIHMLILSNILTIMKFIYIFQKLPESDISKEIIENDNNVFNT